MWEEKKCAFLLRSVTVVTTCIILREKVEVGGSENIYTKDKK